MASDKNLAPALNPLPLADNEGGALNLTRVTGIGAALVTVLTAINPIWEQVLGASTPNWAKPAVVISVIATFAIVAAADILGRGFAAGQRGAIIPMPDGLTAALTPGTDQKVAIAAVRFQRTEDDNGEFLIVKKDNTTVWASKDDLDFGAVKARQK
jgi:hypothetical protein